MNASLSIGPAMPIRRPTAKLLPAIPLWLAVILCCAMPLLWLLAQVAQRPELLGSIRWSAFQWQILGRTIAFNAAAAALATIMSFPAAIVLGRGRGKLAAILIFLLPLGVLMPSVTYTYGWVQVVRLLGLELEPAGPADVLRCIWTLATWLWALPAVAMGLSLRFLDSQVQQQALLDGALWRTTARQLLGPAVAGFAVVLVLAMQEFAVWERSGISVVATEVRTVFETGAFGLLPEHVAAVSAAEGLLSPDQPERAAAAVATAIPMLVFILLLSLLIAWGLRRVSAAEQADPTGWPAVLDANWRPLTAAAGLLLLTLAVPAGAMLMSMARPPDPIRIWAAMAPQAWGTLLIGGLTGLAALAIALLACIRRSRLLLAIAIFSFLIGGELLAIADIRIYNRDAPWPLGGIRVSGHDLFGWVYNNLPMMVIAYIGRFGWLALFAGVATWSRPFRELRDMSAVDGAGEWRTASLVIWPIVWPVLAASALLIAILSMTEVSATVLLSPQRPQMLVPSLMGWVHMLRSDEMLEASLLLMGMVLVLGLGFVMLVWLGIRLAGMLRRAPGRMLPALAVLPLLAGCEDGAEPDAIWGRAGTGRVEFVYPRAITYSPQDETFFTVDRLARVQRLDRQGRHINGWRMPLWEKGKPTGLSVGPDGNLYIPDTHYARVVVYSPDGELLREWGREGRGPGEFIYPTDVAFDSAGNIYVSEYGDNDRIQVFDHAGNLVRQIGRFGQGDGEFARPQSILISGDLLYVTDACNHRIVIFRTDGSFVRNLGGVGSELGQFRFPYGLEQDSRGRLVVAEFGNNRVQLIDPQTGRGIRAWGVAGHAPGQLAYPWAVTVDRNDRVIVVDSGNNRLQVFSF